jgi:alpha-1,3-glucosyltransferase
LFLVPLYFYFQYLPLLLKEGLLIPYITLTGFYSVYILLTLDLGLRDLLSNSVECIPQGAKTNQNKSRKLGEKSKETQLFVLKKQLLVVFPVSLAGCCALTACSPAISSPPQYPDLFQLLISIFSCAHFILFIYLFIYCIFQLQTFIHSQLYLKS